MAQKLIAMNDKVGNLKYGQRIINFDENFRRDKIKGRNLTIESLKAECVLVSSAFLPALLMSLIDV